MALENEEELQRAMAELTRSMQGLGTDTAVADNELTKFSKSVSSVGSAMAGAAGQVMKGGGAFSSLNGAIDIATKALGGIVGAIPVIGGAAKEFAQGVGEAAKFVMNQLDDLAKNYNALGESGALAADGINGVQRQFKQMGLTSLPTFNKAISQNTQGMVALGGSMAQGAEEFSKIAGKMTEADVAGQFVKLGISIDGIGETTGKYVGALGRYGLTQGKTYEQLAASTQEYIKEVDAIARITGNTRKQQEEEQQKSQVNVSFRAKIADMIDKGQIEEATKLKTYVEGLTGPMAEAARAYATGIPMTKDQALANQLSGDAIRQNTQAVMRGKDVATAVNDTNKGMAEGAKRYRTQLIYAAEGMGNAGLQALDAEALMRKQQELVASGIDPVAAEKQARDELMAAKGATGSFAEAQTKVAGASKDLQELSFNLVKNVVPAVDAFAGSIKRVTGFINEKFGGPTPAPATAPAKPAASPTSPATAPAKPAASPTSPATATTAPPVGAPAKPATGTQKEFLDQMYNNLLAEAKKQGVKNPEVIAKLGTAQSALETGYGKSTAGSQNYFGIKARPGEQGSGGVATQEFVNGKMVTMNQNFRKYGSMQESAADYVKFLGENKRYKDVLQAGTVDEAISAQAKTGYATDPNYGAKLSGIAGKIPGGTTPTGPTSGFQPQLANATPATTLPPAQQAQANNNQTRTDEDMMAIQKMQAEALNAIARTNQQQLAEQKKTNKQLM